MMARVLKTIYIANSSLFVDSKLVLRGENPIFAKFLKEVYKFIELKYPKYYKMDALSKLGFIASEVLLHQQKLEQEPERTGIVLGNSASTYLVDAKHQASIHDRENYFPSPANFVYTLPNVMTGEICIRNGFKGENAVFISEYFDVDFIISYMNAMYQANKVDVMIGGYVDADEGHYEAFMFLTYAGDDEIDAEVVAKKYKEVKKIAQEAKDINKN